MSYLPDTRQWILIEYEITGVGIQIVLLPKNNALSEQQNLESFYDFQLIYNLCLADPLILRPLT